MPKTVKVKIKDPVEALYLQNFNPPQGVIDGLKTIDFLEVYPKRKKQEVKYRTGAGYIFDKLRKQPGIASNDLSWFEQTVVKPRSQFPMYLNANFCEVVN